VLGGKSNVAMIVPIVVDGYDDHDYNEYDDDDNNNDDYFD